MIAIPPRETWEGLLASRGSAEEYAAYLWTESGIPARFRGLRLVTHPLLSGPGGTDLLRMVAGPGDDPEFWRQSWYLWGAVGVGKTGLAVGYAYQWVDPDRGDPSAVVYYAVPDLLARIRASYNAATPPHGAGRGPAPRRPPLRPPRTQNSEPRTLTDPALTDSEWNLVQRCRTADLLLLDDLGAEQAGRTGWVEDRLLLVVGWRHDEKLPTVYTSNLSPRELAEHLGERIVWRIVESCGEANILHVEGPNLRAPWAHPG